MGRLQSKHLSNTCNSMATILIDPFPAMGHYNGSLGLAKILRDRGHTVVYTGLPMYAEKLERAGYEFHKTGFIIPVITKENFLTCWFDGFISLFNNTCLKEAIKSSEQYDTLIEKVKPDLILLDVFQLPKAVAYKKHDVRVVGFDIMVAASYAPNIPPYGTAFIPKNSYMSKKYVDWQWFLYDFRNFSKHFLLKILYFGNDRYSLYRKIGKINHVPLEKWSAVKRICSLKIVPKDFYELILTPKCFDFPRPHKEQIIYVESNINKRDEVVSNLRYLSIRDSIVKLKKTYPDMKFIFVSIGTVSGNTPKREARFIQILIDYCRKYNDHRFVFSIGNNFNINALQSVPESLYIFNHVPQLDILKYCDFMITHGGMNSLTECIVNEVPVIVYPLLVGNPIWDQNGNSARAVYHGIGVRGKISTMTPANLRKKINKICSNYDFYKHNIKSMKEKLNIDTVADRAITIIESLLNKTAI